MLYHPFLDILVFDAPVTRCVCHLRMAGLCNCLGALCQPVPYTHSFFILIFLLSFVFMYRILILTFVRQYIFQNRFKFLLFFLNLFICRIYICRAAVECVLQHISGIPFNRHLINGYCITFCLNSPNMLGWYYNTGIDMYD